MIVPIRFLSTVMMCIVEMMLVLVLHMVGRGRRRRNWVVWMVIVVVRVRRRWSGRCSWGRVDRWRA